MPTRCGDRTIRLSNDVTIRGYAAVGGKKEGEGPLGDRLDAVFTDPRMGQDTWEQAESYLQREALTRAVAKAGLHPEDLQMIFAGDLLNQLTASSYALRTIGTPF